MPSEIIIRDGTPDDESFFYNSLLHHYKHSSPHTKIIPDHWYYQGQQALIARVLERTGNILKFAALREDPAVVFGFLWGSSKPATVHYCYVKKAFRELGIAANLFRSVFDDQEQVFYTHFTYDGGKITHTRPRLIYHPYLLHGDLWKMHLSKLDADLADQKKF